MRVPVAGADQPSSPARTGNYGGRTWDASGAVCDRSHGGGVDPLNDRQAVTGDGVDAALMSPPNTQVRHTRRALGAAKGQLQKAALKLLGYVAAVVLVLKLIPGLNQALSSLEQVRWQWVAGALVLETVSEMGFVLSWRSIVDPQDLLSRKGGGRRTGIRAAWAQLGGGTLVPGGSLGGVGVGAWILHRFGMSNQLDRRARVQPELPQHRRRCARVGRLRPGAGDRRALRRAQSHADAAARGACRTGDRRRFADRPPRNDLGREAATRSSKDRQRDRHPRRCR